MIRRKREVYTCELVHGMHPTLSDVHDQEGLGHSPMSYVYEPVRMRIKFC